MKNATQALSHFGYHNFNNSERKTSKMRRRNVVVDLQAGDTYGYVAKLRYFFVFDSHGTGTGSC